MSSIVWHPTLRNEGKSMDSVELLTLTVQIVRAILPGSVFHDDESIQGKYSSFSQLNSVDFTESIEFIEYFS